MKVLEGRQALAVLARGMAELAELVGTTYGPDGSRVVMSRQGKLLMTMDGSSIAREIKFRGAERLGAALVRAASSVMDAGPGDGTSTTILLANALVQAALDRYSTRTWDPVGIARDLRAYLPAVEELIMDMARKPDEHVLRRAAVLASHGDKLVADTVVEAVTRVGEGGTVLITAGDGVGIEADYRDGLVLDVGWASHSLGMGDGTPQVMEGPMVAVVDARLTSFEGVRTMMEEASQWRGRDLVLFCRDVVDTALDTILYNVGKHTVFCMAVAFRGPDARDHLEDIAAATNTRVVNPTLGDDLKHFQADWLGSARKITVGKDRTEIISYPDADGRIQARVKELNLLAEQTPSDYDRDRYHERASSLDGGLCALKVGGYTDTEARERRFRVEDTLHSVQETLRSGVVPGAGRALQFVSTQPELQTTDGGRVLARALTEPLRVLCDRSGDVYGTLPLPADDPWMGWCPIRHAVEDFGSSPHVVDPTGVVLESLRAATSVACEVIMTEVILAR